MVSSSYLVGGAIRIILASASSIRAYVHCTHPFNGPLSGTTQVSQYQKGKTNLDFTEARDNGGSGISWAIMQVCTSLQTDNHTSTPPLLCFLQAGCPSCRPTNSVKALKANHTCIAICPNMERCCDWIIAVRLGCLVILLTSLLQTDWCHLIPSIVIKHN